MQVVLAADGMLKRGSLDLKFLFELKPVAGFGVDIFPAWSVNGKVFVYPHTKGELDLLHVYPLGKCKVSGAPVPANPDKMLALNYGKNWRVPDPFYRFDSPSARVKHFGEFARAVRRLR